MMHDVPAIRLAAANDALVRADGEFVVYWMIAQRRTSWNFALQHAAHRAASLGKPLVVLEALRCDYPWASDRLHRFVLEGMADNARALAGQPVLYYPYIEPTHGAGGGLLKALSQRAAVVVTDEFPCFFLPRMVRAFARTASVAVETVDGNGVLPLRTSGADFPTAHAFRRFAQRELPVHWGNAPRQDPLAGFELPRLDRLPAEITRRWPAATLDQLADPAALVARLPIDHFVAAAAMRGGSSAASQALTGFVRQHLDRYGDDRNHPDDDVASGLSPYLHFGHISAHEVFGAVLDREPVSLDALTVRAAGRKPAGKREGWWGLSPAAEAFLDQLLTWRELGYHFTFHRDDYDRYGSLPDWAQATLARHRRDRRPHAYDLEQFEAAQTHDPLWNAAQRQLVREGRLHNYLRMLWGKKILHWSATPEDALDTMIHLNNKYAVDGRNPNSYSGIFWTLGRFDRPWGPERPVFGTVRYMTSENTARKLRLKKYLHKYGEAGREN